MTSEIGKSAMLYLVIIIISLYLGRVELCIKHVFILYPLWFRNITTEQKFKVGQRGGFNLLITVKYELTCHAQED